MHNRSANETSAIRVLSELLSDEEARLREDEARRIAEKEAERERLAAAEAERVAVKARLKFEREQAAAEKQRAAERQERVELAAARHKAELEVALAERVALEKVRLEHGQHEATIPPRTSRAPVAALALSVAMSVALGGLWFFTQSRYAALEAQLANERTEHAVELGELTSILGEARRAIVGFRSSHDEAQRRLDALKQRSLP